jgi:hypothetical protein
MTDQQALRRIVSMTLLGLRLRPADTLIRLEAAAQRFAQLVAAELKKRPPGRTSAQRRTREEQMT